MLEWLERFLPVLRCPASHQPLRWASDEEVRRTALPPGARALASIDGKHVYPIDDGIPLLFPESASARNDD